MTKNAAGKPVALSLTVLGALARLLPHPPNFAPVGGVSLFAGARLPAWQAYLVPLALMVITDPIYGAFYGVPAYSRMQLFTYGSFLIAVWLGRSLRGAVNIPRIAALSVINSIQFFVITNFGTWLGSSHTYAHSVAGLTACYIAAIPFFGWTLASDAFYTAALFGLYAWLTRNAAARERAAMA
ncbi:MAG TPA: DUF6580 family putative transport protein [Bryobacteraceae bacterium]|nr:DUF6580 family putative transport protein [Bryobacteraceae bacterium]